MKKTILENNLFKLIQTDEKKYEIIDKDGKLVIGMEGNFTKEQLEEQFNNCHKSCIII